MAAPGTHAEPQAPVLVRAFAANSPASTAAKLFVTIPSQGGGHSWPVGWAPRTPLPKEGDECLVGFDNNGNPWVLAWPPQALGTDLVSALPSAPYDGQVVAYQNAAMDTAGVVWRLRYRAASASAYKWEFVGGAALYSYSDTHSKAAAAETWEAISGPSLTTPLAGDYEIRHDVTIEGTSAVSPIVIAGISVAGGVPNEESRGHANPVNLASGRTRLAVDYRHTALAAAQTLEQRYWTNTAETMGIYRAHLLAVPVRVG